MGSIETTKGLDGVRTLREARGSATLISSHFPLFMQAVSLVIISDDFQKQDLECPGGSCHSAEPHRRPAGRQDAFARRGLPSSGIVGCNAACMRGMTKGTPTFSNAKHTQSASYEAA